MDIQKIKFGPRYTFQIPSEDVSPEGQKIIRLEVDAAIREGLKAAGAAALRSSPHEHLPTDWSWAWMVPRGKYAGALPKRLASWAYKMFSLKLSPELLSRLGNLAREHTAKAATYWFDFNYTFDWTRGDFGDQASCFFGDGDKPYALPLIQSLQGFSLRLYDGPEDGAKGLGRAWIIPYKLSRVSGHVEEGEEPDALLIFNGYGLFKKDYQKVIYNGVVKQYGEMQTYDYGRLFAAWLGASYQPILLSVNGSAEKPLWINNDGKSAMIIGPIDLTNKYKPLKADDDEGRKQIDLKWSQAFLDKSMTKCDSCGRYHLARPFQGRPAVEMRSFVNCPRLKFCPKCFERYGVACVICDARLYANEAFYVYNRQRKKLHYCPQHEKAHTFNCGLCGVSQYLDFQRLLLVKRYSDQRLVQVKCCPNCADPARHPTCSACGVLYDERLVDPPDYRNYQSVCPRCRKKRPPVPVEAEDEGALLVIDRLSEKDQRLYRQGYRERPVPPGAIRQQFVNYDGEDWEAEDELLDLIDSLPGEVLERLKHSFMECAPQWWNWDGALLGAYRRAGGNRLYLYDYANEKLSTWIDM